MSIDWNTEGDFGSVIDGTSALVLRRRGSASEVAIPNALRRSVVRQEAAPSNGNVIASDAVWEFEMPTVALLPSVGDILLEDPPTEPNRDCWTILTVEPLRNDTRTRCSARSLSVKKRLDQQVAIELATWQDLGSGPEITGWRRIRTGVPARIQPLEIEVDQQATPLASTSHFEIFLADNLPLDHNHRLVDATGAIYTIDRYSQAERIDASAVVEASIFASGG